MRTMCADVIRCGIDAGDIDPQRIFVPLEDAALMPIAMDILRDMLRYGFLEEYPGFKYDILERTKRLMSESKKKIR